jgi:hypothetical protein
MDRLKPAERVAKHAAGPLVGLGLVQLVLLLVEHYGKLQDVIKLHDALGPIGTEWAGIAVVFVGLATLYYLNNRELKQQQDAPPIEYPPGVYKRPFRQRTLKYTIISTAVSTVVIGLLACLWIGRPFFSQIPGLPLPAPKPPSQKVLTAPFLLSVSTPEKGHSAVTGGQSTPLFVDLQKLVAEVRGCLAASASEATRLNSIGLQAPPEERRELESAINKTASACVERYSVRLHEMRNRLKTAGLWNSHMDIYFGLGVGADYEGLSGLMLIWQDTIDTQMSR